MITKIIISIGTIIVPTIGIYLNNLQTKITNLEKALELVTINLESQIKLNNELTIILKKTNYNLVEHQSDYLQAVFLGNQAVTQANNTSISSSSIFLGAAFIILVGFIAFYFSGNGDSTSIIDSVKLADNSAICIQKNTELCIETMLQSNQKNTDALIQVILESSNKDMDYIYDRFAHLQTEVDKLTSTLIYSKSSASDASITMISEKSALKLTKLYDAYLQAELLPTPGLPNMTDCVSALTTLSSTISNNI
jgi:hypothetical protein